MNAKHIFIVLLATGLTACAGVDTTSSSPGKAKKAKGQPYTVLGPANQALGETAMLVPKPGVSRESVNNEGVAYAWRAEEIKDDVVHKISSGGCNTHTQTQYASVGGPDSKWWNCSGEDSENATIVLEEGQVWPMQVGNTWKVSWKGKSAAGRYWRNSKTCEVTAEERVQTPAGEFDAYKTVCHSRSTNRKNRFENIRYISPAANGIVAGSKSKNGRVTRTWALEALVED